MKTINKYFEDLFDDIEKPEKIILSSFCAKYKATIKDEIIKFKDNWIEYNEEFLSGLINVCKLVNIKKVIIEDFLCDTSKSKIDFANVPLLILNAIKFKGKHQKLVIENLNLQSDNYFIFEDIQECIIKKSNIYSFYLRARNSEVKFDKSSKNQFARVEYTEYNPNNLVKLFNEVRTLDQTQQTKIIKKYIKSVNINIGNQYHNSYFSLEKCYVDNSDVSGIVSASAQQILVHF